MSDEQTRISSTLIACRNPSPRYFAKETLLFVCRCGPAFLLLFRFNNCAAIISDK